MKYYAFVYLYQNINFITVETTTHSYFLKLNVIIMRSTFRTSNDSTGIYSFKKYDYTVHQHMLAHYRRLYSAKSGVDTTTPTHFKPRYKPKPRPSLPVADMSSHPQLTTKDMKFLKCLAGEVRTWWNRSASRHSPQSCGEKNCAEKTKEITQNSLGQDKSQIGLNENQSGDHNTQSMTALTIKNSPKKRKDTNVKRSALTYGVPSKLREMNVYHPPRRRLGLQAGMANKYCGQCASKINKGSHMKASGDIAATSNLFANEISSVIEEQKEELLYLHFIQDITQDILSNEIYSNDGLMMIFKKHLSLNREKLDRDKMIKELQKLGLKIGLPHYNYPTFFGTNSLTLGELSGETDDYEFYDEYHPKVKNSSSLTSNHKVDSIGDFNESLSSMSEKGEEIGLMKQGEICEKKKKESKVLGFLEEMGFDSNIAEEICVCMTDKDFSKFQFTSNESDASPGFHGDFANARDVDSFDSKKEHPSKSVTELFHYCDAGFVFGDDSKTQASILFDQEDTMEMERILESIHDHNTDQDDIGSLPAISSNVHRKSRESEKESTFEADLLGEGIQEKHCKKDFSEQKSKANSASPMGSDYSSMKDHDESIYEGYSEEQDEGQESASEEAEEIPEDLSQSSVSSGISQITEKLKEFNVDMSKMVSRSSERNNLSSDNNAHSLRELVL